jgi:hypothetical protein
MGLILWSGFNKNFTVERALAFSIILSLVVIDAYCIRPSDSPRCSGFPILCKTVTMWTIWNSEQCRKDDE